VTFEQVECPAALTAKSGCVRANDALNESPTGAAVVPTFTAVVPTFTAAASSAGTGTATSSAGGGSASAVPKYGQCGGIGYTGSTVCVAGTTCTVSSEYYSQCL
jgi:hypothetical protein